MRPSFASQLRCPVCHHDGTLRLNSVKTDAHETRVGVLVCSHCGAERPVERGVADLLVDPPEYVIREAAGLGRFAERMREDGWTRETILGLPDIDLGYWYVQRKSIEQLQETIEFRPGEWLLDLGSNTCWASNRFARHGLNVIALDISLWEMQGLWTADWFIAQGSSYFERVLATMNEIPLASDSLDYVYACEVLHHNAPNALRRAFEEAYRVLRPGGRMLVVNETLKTYTDPSGVHTEGVAEFEGHEHAHWAARYRWEAVRAGFSTTVLEPTYHYFYTDRPPPERVPLRPLRPRVYDELRRNRIGRRAYLSWINYVKGGTSFGMIATKPARPRLRALRTSLRDPRRRAARSG
jgi:SAM-dependent methyltransferase